ncbi:MAG: hypothetical protein IKB01_01900 [Lachnospiraceae bacterium]|nr:hypothetical protein [Lachnospiraceae bacterium]
MKKFRILSLALLLVLALSGCGGFSEGLEAGMNDAMNGKTETEAEPGTQTEEPEVAAEPETVEEETQEVEPVQEEKTAPEETEKVEPEVAEPETTEPEPQPEPEKETEEQSAGSINILLTAPITEHEVKNGSKTEVIGEWAEIVVAKELMLATTQEEYAEFCETVVADSGYNWFTISFGDGYGIQFQGSISYVATYGTLDTDGCIEEAIGTIMIQGDGTYSYTEN